MRVPLVLAVFIATASTANAECLSSAEAVWAAHTDAPRNVGSEIAPVSAIAVPRPRPQLQSTLAETERAPPPASAKPASTGEARSILIWGTPIRIDPTWDELFTRRERRAE